MTKNREKYFGGFAYFEDLIREFDMPRSKMPPDKDILWADYDQGAYEGHAQVIFRKGRKLYEVSGAHCSCYGLEGQWRPGKVTWQALALRLPALKRDTSNAARALESLILEHLST